MNLDNLYEKLNLHSDFDVDDNTEKFLDIADQIILQKDINCIKQFIKYFDDNSEYSWVLESLSKSIEYLDPITYVQELIKNMYLFFPGASEWACTIFFRIFNDPNYLNLFRANMHLAEKESLLKLFDLMEVESPHHHELIQELRQELNKSS